MVGRVLRLTRQTWAYINIVLRGDARSCPKVEPLLDKARLPTSEPTRQRLAHWRSGPTDLCWCRL